MIALKIKEHNESYLHQINCYICKKKKKKKKKKKTKVPKKKSSIFKKKKKKKKKKNRKFESKKYRKVKDHYHYTGK